MHCEYMLFTHRECPTLVKNTHRQKITGFNCSVVPLDPLSSYLADRPNRYRLPILEMLMDLNVMFLVKLFERQKETYLCSVLNVILARNF